MIPAPVARLRHARCGACGTSYERAQFQNLAPVSTLHAEALTEIVVRWPEGAVIDVRACTKCRAPIACLTRTP